MATRIYLPSSGTPAVTPAAWNFPYQAATTYTLPGSITKTSTAITSRTAATGTTSPRFTGVMRYVIGPLAAVQISGTANLCMRCSEGNAGANATLGIAIKLITSAGADRSVLLAYTASDAAISPYEMTTTLSTKRAYNTSETRPIPLTSQTPTVGDYLVIEIGFRSATTTSRTITLSHGDAAANDCPDEDNNTAANNPWVDFSGTIVFILDGVGATDQLGPITLIDQAPTPALAVIPDPLVATFTLQDATPAISPTIYDACADTELDHWVYTADDAYSGISPIILPTQLDLATTIAGDVTVTTGVSKTVVPDALELAFAVQDSIPSPTVTPSALDLALTQPTPTLALTLPVSQLALATELGGTVNIILTSPTNALVIPDPLIISFTQPDIILGDAWAVTSDDTYINDPDTWWGVYTIAPTNIQVSPTHFTLALSTKTPTITYDKKVWIGDFIPDETGKPILTETGEPLWQEDPLASWTATWSQLSISIDISGAHVVFPSQFDVTWATQAPLIGLTILPSDQALTWATQDPTAIPSYATTVDLATHGTLSWSQLDITLPFYYYQATQFGLTWAQQTVYIRTGVIGRGRMKGLLLGVYG